MKKLLIVAILSLFSMSALADVQWTVNDDLKLKYTFSCADESFDAIYIYRENDGYMGAAIKKYENSAECIIVVIVTDPVQQNEWNVRNRLYNDMMSIARMLPVPVYIQMQN